MWSVFVEWQRQFILTFSEANSFKCITKELQTTCFCRIICRFLTLSGLWESWNALNDNLWQQINDLWVLFVLKLSMVKGFAKAMFFILLYLKLSVIRLTHPPHRRAIRCCILSLEQQIWDKEQDFLTTIYICQFISTWHGFCQLV